MTASDPQAELLPHVRSLLQRLQRKPAPALHQLSPQEARTRYAAGAQVLEIPSPADVCTQMLHIPVRDGTQLAARLYQPAAQPEVVERMDGTTARTTAVHPASSTRSTRATSAMNSGAAAIQQATTASDQVPWPLMVFFHGGGFVVGSIDTHDTLCRVLCQRSHCAIVSVDYRLAPEYRFPTAFEDAWDAICWLHKEGGIYGLSTDNMAVGGDSAGGTLAAACAVEAARTGLPLRLQLLFYPGMYAQPYTPSRQRYANGFLLTQADIAWMFQHYARSEDDFADWRFAPVLAQDVEHVAPLWLGLAQCDPLFDDSMAWADHLRMAGVAVDLEVYPGVIHEFIKMGRAVPEALQAHAHAAAALRQALWRT